jgi:hypothetical protein
MSLQSTGPSRMLTRDRNFRDVMFSDEQTWYGANRPVRGYRYPAGRGGGKSRGRAVFRRECKTRERVAVRNEIEEGLYLYGVDREWIDPETAEIFEAYYLDMLYEYALIEAAERRAAQENEAWNDYLWPGESYIDIHSIDCYDGPWCTYRDDEQYLDMLLGVDVIDYP